MPLALGSGSGTWSARGAPRRVDGIVTGCILAVAVLWSRARRCFIHCRVRPCAERFFSALHSSSATLTVALYIYANERGQTAVAFAIATILMLLTLMINLTASLAGQRLKKQ